MDPALGVKRKNSVASPGTLFVIYILKKQYNENALFYPFVVASERGVCLVFRKTGIKGGSVYKKTLRFLPGEKSRLFILFY